MSMILENQLLATKFYVPVAFGTLISRPRLSALLCAESEASPHTDFCSSRLRQDYLALYVGTIAACKPTPAGLGVSRRGAAVWLDDVTGCDRR